MEKPIIWKKEACLVGQCKGLHDKHWWSIPFTMPSGLMVECYHCHKTRLVSIPSDFNNEITDKEGTEWIRERLAELKS